MNKSSLLVARFSIFLVYFWFGLLKLLSISPATSLVHALFSKTVPFVPFQLFYSLFSLFEICIAFVMLVPGLERLGLLLIGTHLFSTALPLVLLPNITWQGFLVPTMEGQYILKNIVILALAIVIYSYSKKEATKK